MVALGAGEADAQEYLGRVRRQSRGSLGAKLVGHRTFGRASAPGGEGLEPSLDAETWLSACLRWLSREAA
jgi:hypothetical protein